MNNHSNTMKFLSILFFYCNITVFCSAECPDGTRSGLTSNICYQLHPQSTTWLNAEYTCGRMGGHLASVPDAFTNTFLSDLADGYFKGSTDFWLGECNGFDIGNWAWSDFSPFTYTNWAKGQTFNGSYCISSQLPSGYWYASACTLQKPFICEIVLPIDPCPPHWDYWQYTNKCYFFYEFNGIMQAAKNFTGAIEYCQNLNATLVSVHNYAENAFISAQGLNYFDDSEGLSWLGLSDPLHNGDWQWLDGTKVDFTYWATNQPDGKSFCAMLENGYNSEHDFQNRWITRECDLLLGTFWCSMDSRA